MMNSNKTEGFTGLEAAIVLIAFVVVAAVFSYVVLGAGFFTTQKSEQVVYTSVAQASSSIEVLGDVYGNSTTTGVDAEIGGLRFVVGLTAGGTPMDFSSTTITFSTKDVVQKIDNVTAIASTSADVRVANNAIGANKWGIIDIANPTGNNYGALLENQEQFTIFVQLGTDTKLIKSQNFNLEIRPAKGASYGIKRQTPPKINKVNILY